jgi:selenide,water dikinase
MSRQDFAVGDERKFKLRAARAHRSKFAQDARADRQQKFDPAGAAADHGDAPGTGRAPYVSHQPIEFSYELSDRFDGDRVPRGAFDKPRYALATVAIPLGSAAKVEEDLYQVISGARATLDLENVALVGGHSAEGADLAVGFSVTGEIAPDRIVRKGGLRAGDVLVLTKPLGTGILFAAAMRAKADAAAIEAALTEMLRSNRRAAEILVTHGATAMTDVSGFGLAGHLGEMLSASGCRAVLDLSVLPLHRGVWHLAQQGIASTMLPENLALRDLVTGDIDAPGCAVLFDPQTAGGFLAGVPLQRAAACVKVLRDSGYVQACAIGEVIEASQHPRHVSVILRGMLES